MKALESNAPLIVYIDIKSPYAFVAYRPTLALEKELGLKFDWRPLTLDIPSYLGSAEKRDGQVVASEGRSQQIWRAIKYSYHDARRYAERQGLVLKGTEKIWDSSIANIGLLWVRQQDTRKVGDFLEAVFPRFWQRALDIEDAAVVKACLTEAGVSTEGFEPFLENEGRITHDGLQAQLHDSGIYGVPTYVIGDEVLMGREHIPYLRWRLSGQKGPPPDIAYEVTP